MSVITLRTGLEFNYGQAFYNVVRIDMGDCALIENIETGARHKVQMSQVVTWILNSKNPQKPNEEINKSIFADTPTICQSKRESRVFAYVSQIRKIDGNSIAGKKIRMQIDEIASSIGDLTPPSLRTLARWLKNWDAKTRPYCKRGRKNPDYLKHPGFDLAIDVIQHKYLNRQGLSIADAYGFYAVESRERKLPKVSISTFRRILKTEFDAYVIACSRLGQHEARKRFRMTMKTYGPTRPYEILEVDHTPLDWVVCTSNRLVPLGRPTLVVVRDVATSYVVAAHITFLSPSVATVAKVLKTTFFPKKMDLPEFSELKRPWLGYGVPEQIKFDNGIENHSAAINALLGSAGIAIQTTYCKVRTPWSKPHVESLFSMLRRHMKVPAGYVFKASEKVDSLDPKETSVIDFESFKRIVFTWIETVVNTSVNRRTQKVPRLEFENGLMEYPPPQIPCSEEIFDLYATFTRSATLRHDGVRLNGLMYGGQSLFELRKRSGENLRVEVRYSAENLAEIYVQDPKLKKWVMATCSEFAYADGLSLYQHRELQRFRKDHNAQSGIELSNQEAKVRFYSLVASEIKKGTKAKRKFTKHLGVLEGQSSTQDPADHQSPRYSDKLNHVISELHQPFEFDPLAPSTLETWTEDIR